LRRISAAAVIYPITVAESTTQEQLVTVGTGANSAPLITEGATFPVTLSEDGAPVPFVLTLYATEADHDMLTWSILTPAGFGTAGAAADTGEVSYRSLPNYMGSDSFIVQVSDGNGGTDSITVGVTIQPVDDSLVHSLPNTGLHSTFIAMD
jgi:hypothetical protein